MTKMLANKVAFILFDGYNSLDQTTEVTVKGEASTEDTTVLSSSWISKNFATKDLEVTQKGFLDDIAGGIWAEIVAKGEGGSGPFAIGFEGNTLGVRCMMSADMFIQDFSRLPIKNEISKFELTYKPLGVNNALDGGVILYPLSATSGSTGSGNYVDLGYVNTGAITSSAISNPGTILTGAAHNMKVGDTVTIAGHTGSTPSINGTYQVMGVPDSTHFQIGVNITAGGTGGTYTINSGGLLVVHLTGVTSNASSIAFNVTDCDTSGGTYTDVASSTVTFSSTPTGPDALAVAIPNTIRRYVKLKWNFTGGTSPTATVLAAFKRN